LKHTNKNLQEEQTHRPENPEKCQICENLKKEAGESYVGVVSFGSGLPYMFYSVRMCTIFNFFSVQLVPEAHVEVLFGIDANYHL